MNLKDPIPIVLGMFLGYRHLSGEAHIVDDSNWIACPGQDNPKTLCSVGDVPNVFDNSLNNYPSPDSSVIRRVLALHSPLSIHMTVVQMLWIFIYQLLR